MVNQRGRTTGVRKNYPPRRRSGDMSAATTRRGANEGNTPSPSPPPASPDPLEDINLTDLNFETTAATPAPQSQKAPAIKRKASGSSPEQNKKSKKSKTIHPKTQGFSKKNRRTQNKKKGNNRNNSKKGKKKKKKSKRK